MSSVRNFAALLAVSAMLAPASAFAQGAGPAQDGYDDGIGPQIQEQIDQSGPNDSPGPSTAPGNDASTPTAAVATEDSSGELPFTGFDLALVLGAGVLLLGLGFGMRKLTQPSGEAVS